MPSSIAVEQTGVERAIFATCSGFASGVSRRPYHGMGEDPELPLWKLDLLVIAVAALAVLLLALL